MSGHDHLGHRHRHIALIQRRQRPFKRRARPPHDGRSAGIGLLHLGPLLAHDAGAAADGEVGSRGGGGGDVHREGGERVPLDEAPQP